MNLISITTDNKNKIPALKGGDVAVESRSGAPELGDVTGKSYWRSLNQLAGTKDFQQWVSREFSSTATELLEGNSRRTVLKLMGASFGLAGLTACRPVQHILPNTRGVEDYIPGAASHYATAMPMNGVVNGLLVETYDGRPTKIEGNPEHPMSQGATNSFTQASVLGLYDPDRSKTVLEGGKESTFEKFEAALKAANLGDGSGLRFVTLANASPTYTWLKGQVAAKYPKAGFIEYEPISHDNNRQGAEIAFGPGVAIHKQIDRAKVLVSLDYDFLGLDALSIMLTKLFSKGRKLAEESEEEAGHHAAAAEHGEKGEHGEKPEHGEKKEAGKAAAEMNRLYSVETNYSLTGGMADHRLRLKPSEIAIFARDLAAKLGAVPGLNVMQASTDKRGKFLDAVAKDLKAHAGECIVMAGPRQSAAVHALAHAINATLGNIGKTAIAWVAPKGEAAALDQMKALVADVNSGKVQALMVLGGNPGYTAPADLDFGAAVKKVAMSVHLGLDADETAKAAKWHIPEAHYLESWGDGRAVDGTGSIQQPLIEAMYKGKSAIEMLALVAGTKEQRGYDLVRAYWLGQFSAKDAAGKEQAWREALHTGVIPGTKTAEAKASLDAKSVAAAAAKIAGGNGFEIAFYPSSSTYDGRFANNGWLQELPDPMTKLVWGNALMISPKYAKDQGLADGDMVAISKGSLKLEAAVMMQPGHADGCASIALGHGRTECGRVGKGVGFNAYAIRTTSDFWSGDGFTVTKTGKTHVHATTQEHGSMEGRPIVREAKIEEYTKAPKMIEEMSEVLELKSIYEDRKYDTGNQWGMSIDLNSCTGCNACVVACQSENNIPIVGKEQVLKGREMHWLRMDRYYTGDENDPQVVTQALPCLQCENAPCENVCPVAATVHSPEGLNDMAYNRCVGTRYCANNCPVKVRHFNFLNWHKATEEVQKMSFNPNVTVRMRGIMEKCTYCVQRIQETKIKIKAESRAAGEAPRAIKDGEIKTACQQTCPADAIVFGNINDPNSQVAKLKKHERNYALLAELNIKPRTTYLAKLRKPNPELG